MSTENVQTIIGRAIMEPEYRSLLFSDPVKALEGYELTGEEAQALKTLDREKFDGLATQVEERVSKSGLGFSELKFSVANEGIKFDLGSLFQKW